VFELLLLMFVFGVTVAALVLLELFHLRKVQLLGLELTGFKARLLTIFAIRYAQFAGVCGRLSLLDFLEVCVN